MSDSLTRLRRATRSRAAAEQSWRDAIGAAVEAGHSVREVGKAAGVSHARVVQVAAQERERAGRR